MHLENFISVVSFKKNEEKYNLKKVGIVSPWFSLDRRNSSKSDEDGLQKQKEDLISIYRRTNLVNAPEALDVFLKVPREDFLPEQQRKHAYLDRPLPLMNTGQTISAPHMTVMILEYLKLFKSQIDEDISYPIKSVLEIGGGSGYQAALIAEALRVQNSPFKVVSIEIVPKLAEIAAENLKRTGYSQEVEIIQGDGTLGYEQAAPYDRVLLTAAGPRIPPPLIKQLHVGGILSMPLGGAQFWQTMVRIIKKDENGAVEREDLSSVAFVPLRGKHGV